MVLNRFRKKAQKQTKEAEKQKREDKKDAEDQQAKQQKKSDPDPNEPNKFNFSVKKKITKQKFDLTKDEKKKKVIDLTKEKKVVDLTKDEKRKKTVIELSDDEDDKPPPPAPKAKAKRNPQKLTKPGLKAVRKISKSKQPPSKDEKRKTVIELSDDEDKAPKAKAAPNLRKIKKQVKEYKKSFVPSQKTSYL